MKFLFLQLSAVLCYTLFPPLCANTGPPHLYLLLHMKGLILYVLFKDDYSLEII